ncbi:MAG: glycosyltransferase 87 family protein [Dehalococcoidales bacterium]|jgi:hypothetical protein|nr:glycosyltransferase 87 family protein [Dehalococcoidales bacterium]MDD5497902.1 glycosyltransferase 87 family protein [Dehalococcoidales bacterium]
MIFDNTKQKLKEFFISRNRQLLFFGLIHIAVLFIWLNYSRFEIRIHPDVELYFEYAQQMFSGNLPYRDFSVEYPPLAMLFLLLPRLFSGNLAGYADGFAILMLAFDLLGLFFISRISSNLKLGHFTTLAIYTFSFFILGDIVINRFDVIPAVLSLAAIYYYTEHKYKSAWFVLALGVLTKLYPAIIAPLFAIPFIQIRQWKPLIKGTAVFVVTGLIGVVPFLAASPEGFWEFINFHSGRGLQLESGYASLLMLGDILGLTDVEIVLAYSSVDIWAPASDFLVAVSSFVTIGSILICYWFYYRNSVNDRHGNADLAGYTLGVVAILLLTTKVFSTQFVIWLYPIIPLIGNHMRNPAWIMFGIIALLSQYIYPFNYGQLMDFEQPAVIFLILRNLLVFTLGVLVMYASSGFRVSGNSSNQLR